jgi:DNA-binding MarR family transcriptional regulator
VIEDQELKLMEDTDLLFRRVWKKYQVFLMPTSNDMAMSMHQMMFLKFLENKKTCTPSDIAQQFGITLGAVTGFVDRLYKIGLIMRTRSEEDRRVVLIQLSPQGMEALMLFEKERKKKFSVIVQKLQGTQVEELNKALEQFKIVLDDLANNKE